MKRSFALFFLFATSLFADEEIVVKVGRTSTLSPLHFTALQGKNSGLEASYLKELESIVRFDFSHNGKTTLSASSNFDFELKGTVKDKKLSLSLSSTKEKKMRAVEDISLTGKLAEDRRKIHAAVDQLFEATFHEKGIASTHILYTVRKRTGSDSNEWKTEVYECDYDGANSRQVTREGKLCVTPTYIAHTPHFLYVSYRTGQPKLYLASLKEGVSKRVTLIKGNQLMPVLSPKGDLLAFVCDILGNPELFVQRFDVQKGEILGKPWQVTALPTGAQGSPTFSPDGKKMAFVSNKDGAARIYVADVPSPGSSAKTLKLTLISKQSRENTCPAWSPDGTKLAYSSKSKGSPRQIWIYEFKTNKETQLTQGQGDKENAAWAKNSQHLVFHSSTKDTSELCWINLEEKESVKITNGSGEKRFPSWEK